MSIVCCICSDSFGEHYKTVFTQCGHIFHSHCLKKWIKRSNTCPQCRMEVVDGTVHKVFFTYSTEERDFISLEDRNINLQHTILLKQSDVKYYKEKSETWEKQNSGLRKEVTKLEREMQEKNTVIRALRDQVEYFKERSKACENMKQEMEHLKKESEEVKSIQRLLKAPTDSVHKLIGDSREPDVLMRYISVMKGELISSVRKIKRLQNKIVRLQNKTEETSTSKTLTLSEYQNESTQHSVDVYNIDSDESKTDLTRKEATSEDSTERSLLIRPKKRNINTGMEYRVHLPITEDDYASSDSVTEIPSVSKKSKFSHTEEPQICDNNDDLPECSNFVESFNLSSKSTRRNSSKKRREKSGKMKNTSGDIVNLT